MIFTMIKTWTLIANIYTNGSYSEQVVLQGIVSKEECYRAATKMEFRAFTCVETYTPVYKANIQD
jgi:hypothetical protein